MLKINKLIIVINLVPLYGYAMLYGMSDKFLREQKY